MPKNTVSLTSEKSAAIIAHAKNQSLDNFPPETEFYIYGSLYRPMSGSWARIPGAIFVNADYSTDRVHTWVVSEHALAPTVIDSFELTARLNER